MASLREHEGKRPAPRLYLITPEIGDPASFAGPLAGALGAADVAAVLLRLAPGDERKTINAAKTLATIVQNSGAALILDGHPDLVSRSGADGVHLRGIADFEATGPKLKPQRIAGAGELFTRHDAMLAGEAGADYVMFGEPDRKGKRPAFAAILERVAWWAELFEIPCVAYAERFEEMVELCAAGADFIAVGDAVFADPRGSAAATADAASRLVLSGAPA
jgi:thiamine-phosphate pyrophosphorylase